jgi:hypothetical protein
MLFDVLFVEYFLSLMVDTFSFSHTLVQSIKQKVGRHTMCIGLTNC